MAAELTLLEEWGRIFETETIDDVNIIHSITQCYKDIEKQCMTKENEMKTLIKEMTTKTDALKHRTEETSEEELLKKQKDLKDKKANASREIMNMKNALEQGQATLKSLEEKCYALNKEKNDAEADLVEQLAPLRKTLQVMTNISHITWNFDVQNQYRGACHLINKKRVKPFTIEFDDARSKVSIANSMWDMLWEDQEQALTVA